MRKLDVDDDDKSDGNAEDDDSGDYDVNNECSGDVLTLKCYDEDDNCDVVDNDDI